LKTIATAFFSGIAIDILAVAWTRSVAGHNIAGAVAMSILLSLANVRGFGAAIKGWKAEVAFLFGCAIGTLIAMGIR
jgi:hypothetical protein